MNATATLVEISPASGTVECARGFIYACPFPVDVVSNVLAHILPWLGFTRAPSPLFKLRYTDNRFNIRINHMYPGNINGLVYRTIEMSLCVWSVEQTVEETTATPMD